MALLPDVWNEVKQMIPPEAKIVEAYKKKGYEAINKGAPDLLFFRRDKLGKLRDVIFVEVKTDGDRFRPHQLAYKKILQELGLKYKVERTVSKRLEINKEKFIRLWNEGKVFEELADEFGAKPALMHRWRDLLGLTERIKCEVCGNIWNVAEGHVWFCSGGEKYINCSTCGKKTPNSPLWARRTPLTIARRFNRLEEVLAMRKRQLDLDT